MAKVLFLVSGYGDIGAMLRCSQMEFLASYTRIALYVEAVDGPAFAI
jgi:hypothetical protein